jgi:uncharacterized repeat protein (TIGR03803 family)
MLLRLWAAGLAGWIGFVVLSSAPVTGSSRLRVPREVHAAGRGCCTSAETVIYRFRGDLDTGKGPDGIEPGTGLTADPSGDGVLYGTTVFGGKYRHGTVFKLTPSASGYTESVVFSFPNSGPTGAGPSGAPVLVDFTGAIYSTTGGGSGSNCGAVFKLTPTASTYSLSVLHRFAVASDGCFTAYSGLYEDASGALYGTTFAGGEGSCDSYPPHVQGCGTVFKLTPTASGKYGAKVLYRFEGGDDGWNPRAGVIEDASGALYGTTNSGGETKCNCGTVFKLTPAGGGTYTESLIHVFAMHDTPGKNPQGPLIADSQGDFYGAAFNRSNGPSVVYELVPSPSMPGGYAFKVLFHFAGEEFTTSLVFCSRSGAICATTLFGGSYEAGDAIELTPPQSSGGLYAETVLYTFSPGNGGDYPTCCLVYAGGTLYGTTVAGGGPSDEIWGVAFKLSLPK